MMKKNNIKSVKKSSSDFSEEIFQLIFTKFLKKFAEGLCSKPLEEYCKINFNNINNWSVNANDFTVIITYDEICDVCKIKSEDSLINSALNDVFGVQLGFKSDNFPQALERSVHFIELYDKNVHERKVSFLVHPLIISYINKLKDEESKK